MTVYELIIEIMIVPVKLHAVVSKDNLGPFSVSFINILA